MISIVGYTGFVGSNICSRTSFDGHYNSKNIADAFGTKPDLLIFIEFGPIKFTLKNEQ